MASDWHVVIVNFRTPELARDAARSARAALPGASLVVVDNHSTDDCEELIRKDGKAEYLAMPVNRGYGAALNAGVRHAGAPLLLLLNADVQIEPGVPERLQTRLEELGNLGIVAPRLRSPDGTVQPSCRRFPTYLSLLKSRGSPLGWLHKSTDRSYRVPEPSAFTLTDVVAGACWVVRSDVWRELDGMDERFFLYAEDTDFCLRAKQAGWLVGYDPTVRVTHQWGASTGQSRRRSYKIHAESLSWYFRKHNPDRRWMNSIVSFLLRVHALLRF